ncbi:hypothetical protein CERSUDRAFT_111073 [Gelatoporia subvermispora B]|uniref:Uncharacterized protein n=1 Tax=Ceriporiopsis subvermispora (strain B) TaxID=914234 RepID=M2R7U0_CERS8|nr:hypothetical protein CERSUDRAFT_111073 [Gelatoporia subvermispora B]
MSDSVMREPFHEDAASVAAGGIDDDNCDYDYDVFLYWPSSHQFALLIDESPDDTPETPYASGSEYSGSSLESLSDFSTPPTPTYTVTPGFTFPPQKDSMSSAGYSQLFRAGFSYASKGFVRRVDRVFSKIWHSLQPSKN